MGFEDVRQNAIIKKCYTELKDNIKAYLILKKDENYECQFVESLIYLVSEYIDELKITKEEIFSFVKALVSLDEIWIKKSSEKIRLSLVTLVFKCYLRNP